MAHSTPLDLSEAQGVIATRLTRGRCARRKHTHLLDLLALGLDTGGRLTFGRDAAMRLRTAALGRPARRHVSEPVAGSASDAASTRTGVCASAMTAVETSWTLVSTKPAAWRASTS
jgi:hypothetical protein